MHISTFTLNGLDIEMTYHNKSIAYTFTKDGQPYGYKIELPSRKVMDIVAATSLLLINALETRDALTQIDNDNSATRTDDPGA